MMSGKVVLCSLPNHPTRSNQKKKNPVEKVLTPELQFPASEKDFKLFLTVKENKRQLQQLLAEGLLRSAPQNKTIIVSGAFEDPMDVRSSSPDSDTTYLESNHVEIDT